MSNYRTKSLFHYTKEMNSLLEIIKSGILYPNFCKEDLSTKKNPNYILGIPEICFCDIPISMANKFRDNYGSYAIGFDKYWGIDNGCNPLLYVANESIIDGVIHYKERVKELRPNITQEIVLKGVLANFKEYFGQLDDSRAYMYSLGFLKKYMSEWQGEPYCNYDENEWRYILEDGFWEIWWKNGEEYKEWRGETHYINDNGDKITIPKPAPTEDMKKLGLRFSSKEINHIILNQESEIPEFIEKLHTISSIGENEVTKQDLSILTSKITSFERISQDY